jgi:hypothetical protein
MIKMVSGFLLSLTTLLVMPIEISAAQKSVEITIKKTQKTDTEYCLYMVIRNHKLQEVQLNIFGSQVLKDADGAAASFKIMNMMNPALDPNIKIPKGEVASGWSCWDIPSADYKPDTLILKPFAGSRYASIKLQKAGSSSSSAKKTTNANTESLSSQDNQQGISEKLDEILKRLGQIEKRLKP